MKKITFVWTLLCLLVSLSIHAQTNIPWSGDTAMTYAGGTGTEEDPYLIKNGEELALLMKEVCSGNKYMGVYFRLEQDVDLGGSLEESVQWTPIGFGARTFEGVFDGNGKNILNIYQNNPQSNYGGVFGAVGINGVVKNLTIASGSLTVKQYVGGIAAQSSGLIENCRNYASIKASVSGNFSYAGGIVGDNTGDIVGCVNFGSVQGSYRTGGIAGTHGRKKVVEECVNYGIVRPLLNQSATNLGGLIGEIYLSDAILRNSINYGTIDLMNHGGRVDEVGCIVGKISRNNAVVENCFNAGSVYLLVGNINGMIGKCSFGTEDVSLGYLYNDMQMSGQEEALTGIFPKIRCLPTDSMTLGEGLIGFDPDVWVFTDEIYPYLKRFENDNEVKIGSLVPHLNYEDKDNYDVFNFVRNDVYLPSSMDAQWSVVLGDASIEGDSLKIFRQEDKSDSVFLEVNISGKSHTYLLVIPMQSAPISIVPDEHGTVRVFDGESEIFDGERVEENTLLRFEASPAEGYVLDYFTVNGERYESQTCIFTGAMTVSGVFMKDEDPEPWDGTIASGFEAGLGTSLSPYQIRTPQELAFLAQEVNKGNTYEGKYFQLIFNLDMDNREWTPIGLSGDTDETSYSFEGNFDGNDKLIDNLMISRSDIRFVGLWGNAGMFSSISRLTVDGFIKVSNPDAYVGLLVGNSSSNISNCILRGRIEGEMSCVGGCIGNGGMKILDVISEVSIDVSAEKVGGVVGSTMASSLKGCVYRGDTVMSQGALTLVVGGLVGTNNSSNIEYCVNEGTVISTADAGGIAGMSVGTVFTSYIEKSTNVGNVIGVNSGGITASNGGSVTDCSNWGNIRGQVYVGGLVASNVRGSIYNSYTMGDVTSFEENSFVGEIIGYLDGGNLQNLYFDKQLNPGAMSIGNRSGYVEMGTLTKKLVLERPKGFDSLVWGYEEGRYPLLKGLPVCDLLNLRSAALILDAVNDSVYDVIDRVRNNAAIYTGSGIEWIVTKGNTVSIDGDELLVEPKEEVDTVILKSLYDGLEKQYRLLVHPRRYMLMISQTEGGIVRVTDSDGASVESGSERIPGDTLWLSYTCDRGYDFVHWYDGDTLEKKEVIMENDIIVSALFQKKNYIIEAVAEEGGTITPSGISEIAFGGSITYTILANDGYQADSLYVDGIAFPYQPTYTFSNIDSNHNILATFDAKTYRVSATHGENGVITPSGDSMVAYGENITYEIEPNSGYQLVKLLVDGVEVNPVLTYTFQTVISEHSIHAEFGPKVSVEGDALSSIKIGSFNQGIVIENTTNELIEISVFDLFGHEITSRNLTSGMIDHIKVLDGVYLVFLTNGRCQHTRKVIVM